MKILILDDHKLFLDGVVELIKMGVPGAQVQGFFDHVAALDLLAEEGDFDLMLLDLSLNQIDGREILYQLSGQYPALPIIIISATESSLDIKTCFECGAMGFVHKSSPPETMLFAINEVLKGNTYLAEEYLSQLEDTGSSNAISGQGKLRSILKGLSLTERQVDVALSLMQGQSNKQIARDLFISEGTTKKHISAILKALKVDSRTRVIVTLKNLAGEH